MADEDGERAAESVVQSLVGVKGLTNLITIKPKMAPEEVETAIKSAFARNALLDAKKIKVETSQNKVTLNGEVRTYGQREEAERVAWAAPGAFSVDYRLSVEWCSPCEE